MGQVEIGSPTGVTPAAVGDYVYFGTEAGEFLAINWRESKIAWKFISKVGTQPYRSSAAATTELVVVGTRNKRVYGLNPATGEERWSFAARQRIDSSPVLLGNRIFCGSADGRVYELNATNGEKVWEYEAGGAFVGSAAIAGGRMVIANDKGVVFCFGG